MVAKSTLCGGKSTLFKKGWQNQQWQYQQWQNQRTPTKLGLFDRNMHLYPKRHTKLMTIHLLLNIRAISFNH